MPRLRVVASLTLAETPRLPPPIPEVAWFGCNVWTSRRPQRMDDQIHAGVCEIHYLLRGLFTWRIRGRPVTVRPGDIFVTAPDERHDGIARVVHRCEAAWIALRLPRTRAMRRGPASALPGLLRRLAALRRPCFAGDARFAAAFALFYDELSARRGDARATCLAAMQVMIAALLRCHDEAADRTAGADPLVDAAEAALRERIADPPGIAALAASLRVSRATLHGRFVAALGVSPIERLTQLRVALAQDLLRRGERSAAIARRVGFASPQHFAAVFRRVTGTTPSGWRRALRAEPGPEPRAVRL